MKKETKSKFKIKPEVHANNIYIDPKYLKLVEEDIEAFYPLLRRSDFISNLLKSYFSGCAGWRKRKGLTNEDREEDHNVGRKRSLK